MASVGPSGTVRDHLSDRPLTACLGLARLLPAIVVCVALRGHYAEFMLLFFGGALYLPYGLFLLLKLRTPAWVPVVLGVLATFFGIGVLVMVFPVALMVEVWQPLDSVGIELSGVLAAIIFGGVTTALLSPRGRGQRAGRWSLSLLPAAGLIAGFIAARLMGAGDLLMPDFAGSAVVLGWHLGAWLQLVLEYVVWGRLPLAAPWRCSACGYDLRGLSNPEVCPECGVLVESPYLRPVDEVPDEPIDKAALRKLAGGGR